MLLTFLRYCGCTLPLAEIKGSGRVFAVCKVVTRDECEHGDELSGCDDTHVLTIRTRNPLADIVVDDSLSQRHPPMNQPLFSIVVTSFNKERYVGLTLESALSQTYPLTEVVVVDDGSTDNSAAVIERFRDRVTMICKANGGQASAMNVGFAACHGEIVLFLDCDDLLDPETVERIVACWTPELSKAHFKLRTIDEDGSVVPGGFMPPYRNLPSGDVFPTFRRFGLYPAPPNSGNAYARRVLDAIMPLPVRVYRAWPDTPLIGSAPLFGPVMALDGVGGSWRKTGQNYSLGGVEKIRARLSCDEVYIEMISRLGGTRLPRRFAARWPLHLKDKLVLATFSGGAAAGVSRACAALAYIWTVLRWPEYTWRRRLLFSVWSIVMATVPQALLRRFSKVAGSNFQFPAS